MSALRQDLTTGGWVIVPSGRRDRPHEPSHVAAGEPSRPCPLCPGHEAETPPEIARLPGEGDEPWAVRVVPNKFAVLSPSKGDLEVRTEAGLLHELTPCENTLLLQGNPGTPRLVSEPGPAVLSYVM